MSSSLTLRQRQKVTVYMSSPFTLCVNSVGLEYDDGAVMGPYQELCGHPGYDCYDVQMVDKVMLHNEFTVCMDVVPVISTSGFTDDFMTSGSVTGSPYGESANTKAKSNWKYTYSDPGVLSFAQQTSPANYSKWVKVVSGHMRTLGIREDGSLWGWGYSFDGNLNQHTTATNNLHYIKSPRLISPDKEWKDMVITREGFIAIRNDGTMWACGYTVWAELGFPSQTQLNTLTQVGTDTDWVMVSCMWLHTLALKSDGSVWGTGVAASGGLGLGPDLDFVEEFTFLNAGPFISISTTGEASFALTADGVIWSCGGTHCETGRDIATHWDAYDPLSKYYWNPIIETGFTKVVGGFYHVLALKANGTLWAWGDNSQESFMYQPVGDELDRGCMGMYNYQMLPLQIKTGVADISTSSHVSIIKDFNGVVMYRGWDGHPYNTIRSWETLSGRSSDIILGLGVSEGEYCASFVIYDGELWGWGLNYNHELGTSDEYQTLFRSSLQLIDAPMQYLDTVESVSIGGSYAVILDKATKRLLVTGTVSNGSPLPIVGVESHKVPTLAFPGKWSMMCIGPYGGGLFVDDRGTLWTGGANGQYTSGIDPAELEYRSTYTFLVRPPVDFSSDIVALVCVNYALVLLENGQLYGAGNSGFIGGGEWGAYHYHYAQVASGVLAIAGFTNGSLMILHDGTVWSSGEGWACGTNGGSTPHWTKVLDGPASYVYACGDNAFVIMDDGTLWATGLNSFGELGVGHNVAQLTFIQVGTDTDWASMTIGRDFSLGLKTDGASWACGANGSGQFGSGVGTDTEVHEFLFVNNDQEWRQVVSTAITPWTDFTYWIDVDDHLYFSGIEYYFETGRYPYVNFIANSEPRYNNGYTTPIPIGHTASGTSNNPSVIGINKIAVIGWYHVAVVCDDNSIRMWGENQAQQIGAASYGVNCVYPVEVVQAIPLLGDEYNYVGNRDWIDVAAGGNSNIALKADGSIWTWGYNSYGECGHNVTYAIAFPTEVDISFLGEQKVLKIYANLYNMYILTDGGEIWSCGYNASGYLGTGDYNTSYEFVKVIGGDYTQFSTYAFGRLAIKSDGTLWAWGQGGAHNGLPDNTQNQPTPIQIGVDTDWVKCWAGNGTSYGQKSNGSLWAWGSAVLGLSDSSVYSDIPLLMASTGPWEFITQTFDWKVIALKSDGTLWAADNGSHGFPLVGVAAPLMRLGYSTSWEAVGTTFSCVYGVNNGKLFSVTNSGLLSGTGSDDAAACDFFLGQDNTAKSKWKHIDVHSDSGVWLGVKEDGTLWMTGDGYNSASGMSNGLADMGIFQLGPETGWVKSVTGLGTTLLLRDNGSIYLLGGQPALVGPGEVLMGYGGIYSYPTRTGAEIYGDVVDMCVWSSLIVLTSEGALWGRGTNTDGVLGDYIYNLPEFVLLNTQVSVSAVCMVDHHTVFLGTDGSLWSSGYNESGQLGLGYVSESEHLFTRIGTDTDWVGIAVTGGATLAVKEDGTLWTCGSRYSAGHGEVHYTVLTQVVGLPPIAKVYGGYTFSIVVDIYGKMYGCGLNNYGELNLGEYAQQYEFIPIESGSPYTKFFVGYNSTVGLV